MDPSDLDPAEWEALGQAIRERRRARERTLVDLAQEVGLSQPFLSQIENGRARPSMMSLYRIAHALGTTPQALFGGPVEGGATPTLVRAAAARSVGVDAGSPASTVHLLLAGDAPLHVLEFAGLPASFLEYWEHDGFEATYVIDGDVELDLDGDVTLLHPGDLLSYPANIPHRLRAPSPGPVRVLLIETRVEAVQDRRPASHAPAARARRRAPRAGEAFDVDVPAGGTKRKTTPRAR